MFCECSNATAKPSTRHKKRLICLSFQDNHLECSARHHHMDKRKTIEFCYDLFEWDYNINRKQSHSLNEHNDDVFVDSVQRWSLIYILWCRHDQMAKQNPFYVECEKCCRFTFQNNLLLVCTTFAQNNQQNQNKKTFSCWCLMTWPILMGDRFTKWMSTRTNQVLIDIKLMWIKRNIQKKIKSFGKRLDKATAQDRSR